jgi:Lon protease-like protein
MSSREPMALPLLPANTVVYPGVKVSLHVREERLRRVVAECLHHDLPLGVVLKREEVPPGDPLVLSTVGTVARILKTQRLLDGRLSVTLAGVARFQLVHWRQGVRLIAGQVRWLPDMDESPGRPMIDEAYALASECAAFRLEPSELAHLPQDPEALSYWIAHRLPLTVVEQQQLLEQPSLTERLGYEVTLLRRITDEARLPPRRAH